MTDHSISYANDAASMAQDVEKPSEKSVIQADVSRGWSHYVWDTFEKSPQERRFLFKLDAAVLTIGCLGYFSKYLDQSNVSNAFVSGMKEDLNLYGNQLNYMTTCWTVGYVIGGMPSNLILTRVRPSVWLPTMEVIWSVLTFCLSRCNTAGQVYALRFLIGVAESAYFPGMAWVIGSWYRSDELGRRMGIFQAASGLGTLFSGNLAAGAYGLDGKGGFAGWQWLFVIDGIISLPIAIAAYFIIPDTPATTRAWYLSKEEKEYGLQRMSIENRQGRGRFTKDKVVSIFSSWHLYSLTMLYIIFNNCSVIGTPVFAQYLKDSVSPTYTVYQIDNYPTTTAAVQVVATFVWAWMSDTLCKGRRWPPLIVSGLLNILYFVALAVWDIPVGFKWFCFIMIGTFPGIAGPIMSWAQEICTDDAEERALVTSSMVDWGFSVSAWLPLIVWKQVDAPMYRKGYITATCLNVAFLANTVVVWLLHRREKRKKAAIADAAMTTEGIPMEDQATAAVQTAGNDTTDKMA